jgi:hypothetical protein
MLKKIVLATGLLALTATMAPAAFAASFNDGAGVCRIAPDRTSSTWDDPTCINGSNH